MYLKEIELQGFRNYESLALSFHEKVNLITGKNAQGKTNLLESLYIMSLGRSFRTNKDSEMIGFGVPYCKAKSTSLKNEEEIIVELIISKEGKQAKINGMKLAKSAQLLDNLYMVVFSPEDLKIVKEEPEKRRRFIDRELCQLKPVYYKNLAQYKKVLKQRNFLLKQTTVDEKVLDVWDEELCQYGTKMMLHRADFIKKLNQISGNIHSKITDGKEELLISYDANLSNILEQGLKEQQLRDCFREKLDKHRKNDLLRRTSTVGPHRDDLKLSVNGIDIRYYGSQGQQRTAALSLKLAEIKLIKEETGEDAILLLDDVLSELDQDRQSFLINSLSEVQLFITTTEISEDLKRKLPDGYTFYVEQGTVQRVK